MAAVRVVHVYNKKQENNTIIRNNSIDDVIV